MVVTKEEDCLPPATETPRCYSPSSTTPLAELETVRSIEIVESSSFLSPVWYIVRYLLFSFSLCLPWNSWFWAPLSPQSKEKWLFVFVLFAFNYISPRYLFLFLYEYGLWDIDTWLLAASLFSWIYFSRLLVIFCIINLLNYMDRGAIASNGVNGSTRSCNDKGKCTLATGIQ